MPNTEFQFNYAEGKHITAEQLVELLAKIEQFKKATTEALDNGFKTLPLQDILNLLKLITDGL